MFANHAPSRVCNGQARGPAGKDATIVIKVRRYHLI
jgi:hypothetical protein